MWPRVGTLTLTCPRRQILQFGAQHITVTGLQAVCDLMKERILSPQDRKTGRHRLGYPQSWQSFETGRTGESHCQSLPQMTTVLSLGGFFAASKMRA